MRQLTCRIFPFVFFVLLCAIASRPACAQQVGVSWTGGTGNWSVPTNWNPAVVPNNAGSTTYSVSITQTNAAVTLDLLNDTVDDLTLGATDSLNWGGSTLLTLASGTSSNDGTLNFSNGGGFGIAGGGVSVNSGATLSNDGTILTFVGVFGNNGTVDNAGTINDGAASFGNGGTFNNTGTFSSDQFADNSGQFNNSGTARFLEIETAFDNGGSFSNEGTLSNTGTLTISAGCEGCGGTFSFSNSGIINNNSGTMNMTFGCPGNPPNSTCHDVASNTGTINNSATLNLTFAPGGPFTNSGTINNGGTLNLTGDPGGSFTNAGTLNISHSGVVTANAGYTQTAGGTIVDGSLVVSGGSVDIQGGSISGTGTIKGNVQVGGTMMPGDAPGTLTISGNYEQMGTGMFDELMSPTSQSLLDVSGNVMLDSGAELQITLLNGFDPLGQTFDIMNFSGLTGEFANGSSFTDDGFLWDITYLQNQIDVTAVKGSVQAPEPSGFVLLAVGVAGLLCFRRKWSINLGTFLRAGRL